MKTLALMAIAWAVLAACNETQPGDEKTKTSGLNLAGYTTAGAYLSCLEGRGVLVSAHRGGPSAGFPENAVETFERTLSRIPALIETDVRQTADGVLVLMHDETVDRTTNGTGRVDRLTLKQLKALRLRDGDGAVTGFEVPTLDEALGAMRGRTIMQLDVKRGVSLRRVMRAVEAADASFYTGLITYSARGAAIVLEQSATLTVFASADNRDELQALRRLAGNDGRLVIWTGIVRGAIDEAFLELLGRDDIAASGGALGYLDDRAATGDRGHYRRLAEAGLDVIATDRPFKAAEELGLAATGEAVAGCSR